MRSISDRSTTARRYVKECAGKIRHETEEDALHAAHETAKIDPSAALRPYHCWICYGWHVGSVGKEGK
jgi:hypothetical protein